MKPEYSQFEIFYLVKNLAFTVEEAQLHIKSLRKYLF